MGCAGEGEPSAQHEIKVYSRAEVRTQGIESTRIAARGLATPRSTSIERPPRRLLPRLTCVSASGSTFRRGVGRWLEHGRGCAVNRRKCRATVAGGDEDLPTLGNTPGRMRASPEDAAAPLAPCPYGGRTPLTRGDAGGTRPPNRCETRGPPRVDVAPLRVKLRSCVGGGPYAYKLRAGDSGPTAAHEACDTCCLLCRDPPFRYVTLATRIR
jgi:hypothetical protein